MQTSPTKAKPTLNSVIDSLKKRENYPKGTMRMVLSRLKTNFTMLSTRLKRVLFFESLLGHAVYAL